MFCRFCGKEIPSDSKFCPSCGKKQEELPNQSKDRNSLKEDAQEVKNGKRETRVRLVVVCIFVVILLVAAVLLVKAVLNKDAAGKAGIDSTVAEAPKSEPSSSYDQESMPPGVTISSKEEPESGYLFSEWALRLHPEYPNIQTAELTISTRGNNGYFIKLTRVNSTSGQNSIPFSFYIRGGDTVTVDVPLGSYELSYATGSVWRGLNYLFGIKGVDGETRYFKADDIFDFYNDEDYSHGWTVELYEQADGNLSTTEISAEEF